MSRKHWILLLATATLLSSGCGPSDTVTLQGCGATFPAPLYKRWFLEFYRMDPKVRVNYQPTGSSAGIEQFEAGLVQFGGTDEALKKDRLKAIALKLTEQTGHKVDVVQIPLTAGSVALCYNLPDNPSLKLTRKAYVGIILGQITYWDDPHLQSSNPAVALPHKPITFIRRAEGSGTTFVFTNHLNAIDPRWTKAHGGPGVGKTVQWPVGIGGKGNAGVAALIQQTPGAFGYIESGYAELAHLPMAALENHAGNFVQPTAASCREGLQEARFDDVLGATIPDPKARSAYPIVTFTWVVCRKQYADSRMAESLKAVLNYCLESQSPGRGQALSEKLGYVPMPDDALVRARKAVSEIRTD
jgi:phosphate transport system substrate-binding protein